MTSSKADAVFPPVLTDKHSSEPSRECTVVVVDSLELRQELNGSAVERAPRRRIFEIVAPDGRSLVTLDRAHELT